MTPAQVMKLLESAPRARAVTPAKPANDPGAGTFAHGQKFAVQLVWSTTPVKTAGVPQLAIFEAYTLYSVQVERAGRRWYGLRLGFFKDPLSARQVALYARSDFSAAAVVPVSDRECEKASSVAAAAQEVPLLKTRPATQPTDEIVLTPDQPTTLSNPTKPAPAQPPATPGAHHPVGSNRTTGKRRVDKTAEQLLEELGANALAIDTAAPPDELSESGVRHLSVSIVNRRSPLSRLFDRVGRKRPHH
jgi:hypothetical protein